MVQAVKPTDSSSRLQDTLPVSAEQLMEKLDQWEISYKCFKHNPLNTVKDSKSIQGQFLHRDDGGGHIKNLYLRDHKKNNILLIADQDRKIDLKVLKKTINMGRLSFGSPERLMENLGVRPGAVTPFSMITGVHHDVAFFLDLELKSCRKIYAHPLVNNLTLEISVTELEVFFSKIGVVPNWIII